MAHKMGAGSTKNGRDSQAKRLGVKCTGEQNVKTGFILVYYCSIMIIGFILKLTPTNQFKNQFKCHAINHEVLFLWPLIFPTQTTLIIYLKETDVRPT